MVGRRHALALVAVAFMCSITLMAQKRDDKKQDEAQQKENLALAKLVDEVAAGQPAPNDLTLTWNHEDFLKGPDRKEYIPFTVSFDPMKVTGTNVVMYWRVTKAGVVETPASPAKKDDKDKKKDEKRPEFAWESVSSIPMTAGKTPIRVSRSFMVPAGSYDVFVAVKEPAPDKAPKNAPPPKVSILRQPVTVPDFWNDELTTSSVIVAQRIDPLPAPLTPAQMIERPYAALGDMEIIPAVDTKLAKKSELSIFLLIYNPKPDSTNKPDVNVEYNFCQIAAGSQPKPGEPCKTGEKFFNKTNPQNLNGQTLSPQFDLSMGHQLRTGQAVPLASFLEGDYRLEIKVTDKIANKSVTRDVNFTVTP